MRYKGYKIEQDIDKWWIISKDNQIVNAQVSEAEAKKVCR